MLSISRVFQKPNLLTKERRIPNLQLASPQISPVSTFWKALAASLSCKIEPYAFQKPFASSTVAESCLVARSELKRCVTSHALKFEE